MDISSIGAALADPLRVDILMRLLKEQDSNHFGSLTPGSLCVCHLIEILKVAQSRLSYHLKILKDAGLVTETPRGKWTYYSANRAVLRDFCRDLGGTLSECGERRVMMSDEKSRVYDAVRTRYGRAAMQCCAPPEQSCCSTTRAADQCCAPPEQSSCSGAEAQDLVGPSLGCGDPLPRAGLKAGEDVLDLGCGAGGDVIRAARMVLPGMVYGLDMTDEMLRLAQVNRQKAGLRNVVLIKGTMEAIPLPDESVDVVISNCVINLSPDKDAVLREIHRVLRPGGRVAIHDTVASAPFPEQAQADPSLWCACVSGSMRVAEYEEKLRNAGLADAAVDVEQWYAGQIPGVPGLKVGAAFVSARKPVSDGMATDPTGIRAATPADLPQVLSMLTSEGLPVAGVGEHFGSFLVTEGPGHVVSGTVGLEVYDHQALLRSLCVTPEGRGKGTGARLVEAITAEAMSSGCSELYLLTTTADKYFERHGFSRIERDKVEGPVLQSVEFKSACPSTAVVMVKRLAGCCCMGSA